MSEVERPLIGGKWIESAATTFEAVDPSTGESLGQYPISDWSEIDDTLDAGTDAYRELQTVPSSAIGDFLERFAAGIEARADEICGQAQAETGLPRTPRLLDIELPRTTDQLRQAARACVDKTWVQATISPAARIAAMRAPIPGVVPVFGPNNFPLAFNGVSGGDFAAAVATGHPVLAIANPGHPGTTRLLAEQARGAAEEAGLHQATVQMVYRMSHDDGFALVADPRVAAVGFTGSRTAGLGLKQAADAAGTPIYLEMSSINPVVILPGAASEDPEQIAETLADSLLLGSGQFCTNPGITFVVGESGRALVEALGAQVASRPAGPLLSKAVERGLEDAQRRWTDAGAELVAQGPAGDGYASFPNTLMSVDASTFVEHSKVLQTEAFGNMGLAVQTDDIEDLVTALDTLEGNLTGTVFVSESDSDERDYHRVEVALVPRVGRFLINKPPTGVAVVPAMNHGGPYPSTGHPGFTSVGIPASLDRFTRLVSYDNVPDGRLPLELQSANPLQLQRRVDDEWTRAPFEWG